MPKIVNKCVNLYRPGQPNGPPNQRSKLRVEMFVVKAEYRHSDGLIAIFLFKEDAEKCYENNKPRRGNYTDVVEFYTATITEGAAYLYSPDKREEK